MKIHLIASGLLITAALASLPLHDSYAAGKIPGTDDPRARKAVLSVLTNKCNVCHRHSNPGKVFTPDNLDELAPKIYKQVFVKRRMPKGRDIRLTPEEEQQLRDWLETKVVARN
ncbi:hypothetical protein ACTJJ0_29055 [Chitinophaga sp. 22321]|uniref:Haem-binding domain-containing protein n=1 Tax=Chitinophaga hostae TaxID=2831022 RepID=A0ABS5J748_9BACT|nr:hypothetical protein [Chitinophaga hostae]MBS0031043.1 hypothetical protein [Chitinophaga hostae]